MCLLSLGAPLAVPSQPYYEKIFIRIDPVSILVLYVLKVPSIVMFVLHHILLFTSPIVFETLVTYPLSIP